MKKVMTIVAAVLMCMSPMAAEEAELLSNGGFENGSSGFLGYSFEDWVWQGSGATAETNDKIEGEQAMQVVPLTEGVLDQAVALSDADYAIGTQFELIMHYKVLSLPSEGNLSLDCYWEATGGGDEETIKAHDASKLQRVVETVPTTEWKEVKVVTTKPEKSAYFRVRFKVSKSAKVLFDDFSLKYKPMEEPFISVAPAKLTPVEVKIGETKQFQAVHIKQGHLTSATTFAITGTNPDQFSLSATSLAADQSDLDLIITYAPTGAGIHNAALVFDNLNHTAILPNSISLNGTCTNPSLPPSVTVTPTSLSGFEAVVGKEDKKSVHITSQNCNDWVYLKIDHVKGIGFTISDGSGLIGKNYDGNIELTFSPKEAGEFQSTLTVYSQSDEFEPIVVTLEGIGEAKTKENIDWLTDFQWDLSAPLKLLNENFDKLGHNETVVLEGWQNVSQLDERPWWGFDEAKTSPVRGKDRYAKATAYQYGVKSSSTWSSWLITPALDYKNAEGKTFTFSVKGEYLPEDGCATKLEIYYIDANISGEKDTVFFQDLTASFDIPQVAEDANQWRTFFLDLAPYAESVADIFHMGFRFESPNGGEGAVVYYVDNVSWGRTDLPEISVTPTNVIENSAIVGQRKVLAELTVSTKNLAENVSLSVAGPNSNRFELSETTLPAEGGTVELAFTGQQAGVHEAYVVVSAKGAVEKYVPLIVKCLAAEGIESIQQSDIRIQKVLRDGQVIIVREGKEYNVLGMTL